MGLSLEQKELEEEKGGKQRQVRSLHLQAPDGNGRFYRTIHPSKHPTGFRDGRGSLGGQGGRPDLPTRSLSKNRLCPSCSDQPTRAGGGGVADSSSGWGVCKSCPREGWVLGPHHAIQRQDGQDHSTAALSPTVNRGGKEPATNGSFIMISL